MNHKINNIASRDRFGAWLIAFLALGIAYRVVRWAVGMPIWGDEAMLAVNFLDRTFAHVFDPLMHGQVAPPAFLLSSWWLMKYVGQNELVIRSTATICSVASLCMMFFFVRKQLDIRAAVLALAMLAVSYYTVRHGAEFKPYAFDLFFTLVLLLVADAFLQSTQSRLTTIGFLTIPPLTILVSYPAVFVTASVLIVAFVSSVHSRATPKVLVVVGSGLATGLVFVFMYLSFIKPHYNANVVLTDIWSDAFPPTDVIPFLNWLLERSAGRLMAYPIGAHDYGSSVTLALFIAGVVVLITNKRYRLVALLGLPFLFNIMAAILGLYPYGTSARIAQHLAPSICVFAGVGVAALLKSFVRREKTQVRSLVAICAFLALIGFGGIVVSIVKPYKTKDALEVRTLVESMLFKNQCSPILVINDRKHVPINFEWYLGIEDRARFGTDLAKLANATSTRPVCILFFDAARFPQQNEIFQEFIEKYSLSNSLKIDTQGTVYIYDDKNRPHWYRKLIFTQRGQSE